MRIGFQTSRYNGLSLLEELDFAQQHSVNFFDIFFDGWFPENLTEKEHKKIKQLKQKNFLFTVHLPIPLLQLSSTKIDSLITFIRCLRPITTTVHFDQVSTELLQHLCSSTVGTTTICIENTIPDKHNLYNINYLGFMKKAANIGNVQATFDTGHCHANHYNLTHTVEALLAEKINIGTVHAHDNDGTCDAHNTVGNGNIDFAGFFNVLKQNNQNPCVVIEHWTDNTVSLQRLRKISEDIRI